MEMRLCRVILLGAMIVLVGLADGLPQDQAPVTRARRPARHPSEAGRTQAGRARKLDIRKINDPKTMNVIGSHSQGDAVVRAAILLDRIKFSPGEISQIYNDNLKKAVSAFQYANGLTASGNVDPLTWSKLNASQSGIAQATSNNSQQPQNQQSQNQSNLQGQQTQQPQSQQAPEPAQAIVMYVIALEDVSGPFTKLPTATGRNAGEEFILREARLKQLNYESAAQLLGEKFHCSPVLLRELNPGKALDKAGTQINVPNVGTPDPPKAASVFVDGATKSVEALDGAEKILALYPATMGSKHDPLPAGDWKITEITHYPRFKYNPNLFWDSEDKNPRAILSPGPKNPVGVAWIGISKEHYGIHGTPNPAGIGVSESHGCIRLTNWDTLELSKIVSVGTPVMIKAAQ